MRKSATGVLRDHARERWLRRAIRSVQLDGDRGAVRRMGEGEWVDSCALVRGVPAELLDVLGVRECEASHTTWNLEAAVHMDEHYWRKTEQVARPLTLGDAAARLGLSLGHDDLRVMRMAAIRTVSENLSARLGRERGQSA